MKGEKRKLFQFLQHKRITITVVNSVDKRMRHFFKSKWNYHPNVAKYSWINENYITDKSILRMIPLKEWYALSVDERIELKAILMIRQHVWKRFHLWNAKIVPRWKVKYAPETDFKVEIHDKTRVPPALSEREL